MLMCLHELYVVGSVFCLSCACWGKEGGFPTMPLPHSAVQPQSPGLELEPD